MGPVQPPKKPGLIDSYKTAGSLLHKHLMRVATKYAKPKGPSNGKP